MGGKEESVTVPDGDIRSVQISFNVGRYNMLSSDKSDCLELRVFWPMGLLCISQTWDEGECPEDRTSSPGEVLDAIEERVESYFASTSRKRDRLVIAALRERLPEITKVWAEGQIAHLEERINDIRRIAKEAE